MELLATNQPWNLILFMVIPVGMAEALVATEFFTLYWGEGKNKYWRLWNKYIGMILGVYFLFVFLYTEHHDQCPLLTHPFQNRSGLAIIIIEFLVHNLQYLPFG